jgi:hypothetical protein
MCDIYIIMSYTQIMRNDLLCNYVDIQKRNASDILMDCINQKVVPDKRKEEEEDDGIINTGRPIPQNSKDIIEGFTSDTTIHGGGVENKREGNKDPRGMRFCRNGSNCDYSQGIGRGDFLGGNYQYCPKNTKFQGVNQSGEIVCSK